MRRIAICVWLMLVLINSVHAGEVVVKEATLNIPTYLLGPEDKNPPFWDVNIYPYPMQNVITRTKQTVSHKIVVLENDYIHLVILPDIGGRIYAAHDRTNRDFDFIYRNHVIKPGLVASRGAWISGGIEWNFPSIGHTVDTISPVSYKIIHNKDGSVSCVVGTSEWVRRMRWVVFTTLYPDRAYIENKILLVNPALVHNSAYFWVNAAAHAWPDTQVILPPTDYTYGHFRDMASPWPIRNGTDISWYKNIPDSGGYFSGVPGDFNGAYNHNRDNGTAHWADRFESPGRKFWTWGTARKGAIWEDILTDKDGQYIEIQSGRMPTQSDTWVFEPQTAESWKEYWYPLKKMRGFVKATPDAAVNFKIEDSRLFFALNTTRVFKNAQLNISCDGQNIHSGKINIDPRGYLAKTIPLLNGNKKGKNYVLTLLDNRGREIIRYSTEKETLPAPALKPAVSEAATVEEIYLKGTYAQREQQFETAVTFYEAALAKDPKFIPALRSLGVIYYQLGQYEKSRDVLQKIMERNEDDDIARYYRALCNIRLGISDRTEEDLHIVGRKAAWRSVVPYVLAAMAVSKGDLDRARELLLQAVHEGPDNLKARIMLAAVLRHQDRLPEGRKYIDEVLRDDPLGSLAIVERKFAGRSNDLEVLRNNPQNYLETACDYAEMNLIGDSKATLELYNKRNTKKPNPMVYFYLGYYQDKLGRPDAAREYFRKGVAISPDYVFPFRTESLAVLETALRYQPNDWRIHYYLGTLLVAKLFWQEGLKHLEKAREAGSNYSVLYRNLAEIYAQKLVDREKAIAAYEKAVSCAPGDYTLYVGLDEQYAAAGKHEKRAELFKKAPAEVAANFKVLLRQAHYYIDIQRYDEALKILREHTFVAVEHWPAPHQAYVLALHSRADQLMKQSKYSEAIVDLKSAMEYPENLGVGKPAFPDHVRIYYKLGCCYEALKDKSQALELFKKAAAGVQGVENESFQYELEPDRIRYQADALRKLGRVSEAEELLKKAAPTSKGN